jgi:hypothetical protein
MQLSTPSPAAHCGLCVIKLPLELELSCCCCCCGAWCGQVVFGLRQQYGAGNISVVNETAMQVHGPLTVRVLVLNGSTNGSSNASDVNATSVNAASNSTGELALPHTLNVTCLRHSRCTVHQTYKALMRMGSSLQYSLYQHPLQ